MLMNKEFMDGKAAYSSSKYTFHIAYPHYTLEVPSELAYIPGNRMESAEGCFCGVSSIFESQI